MKKLLSTNILWAFIACIIIGLNACKKETDKHPQILTEDPIALSINSVEFKGKIVEKGEFSILDYGFLYGNAQNIDEQSGVKVSMGKEPTNGEYSTIVEDIGSKIYGTVIYVRSFLTNSNGTAYGTVKMVNLPVPSASSVSPSAGKVGDLITITGQFHTSDTTGVTVSFQSTKALIKEISENKIVVQVPSNIPASHNSQIGITLQIGQQNYPVTYDFRIQASIKDFSPKTGSIGSAVTLVGENLPSYYSGNQDIKLYFDDVEANYLYYDTPTYLVPLTVKEKSKVYISINDVKAELPGEFTIIAPTISSVSTESVLSGGAFEIYGTGFATDWSYLKVKLGSYELNIASLSESMLSVTVPANVPTGNYALTIISGPHTITANSSFKVVGYTVSGFSPSKGSVNSVVDIQGVFNKDTAYDVSFGSIRITAYPTSNTNLRVNVPNGVEIGKVKIIVHFPGKDITVPGDFEVVGPVINSFSPSSGVPGTAVTITGEGFAPDTWNTKVKFGTIEATITSVNETQIKVLVPSNINPGAMKINVETNGQNITSDTDFTVKN